MERKKKEEKLMLIKNLASENHGTPSDSQM